MCWELPGVFQPSQVGAVWMVKSPGLGTVCTWSSKELLFTGLLASEIFNFLNNGEEID